MSDWLQRSGIKKAAPGSADDQTQGSGREHDASPTDTPEVANDKATPVVGDERGIPSVNKTAFRSKALPLTFGAVALAAVALVWLIPSPKVQPPAIKNDPLATKDQRFDESKPSAVLVPNSPPVPPEPQQQVSLTPEQPHPLVQPKKPIEVIPAIDKSGSPGAQAGRAGPGHRALTPLERRQQSKMLLVGDSEKGVDGPQGPAPLAGNPGYMKTSAMSGASLIGGEGSGEGGGDAFGNMLRPTVVAGTSAGRLASRTFMMTQGTLLDCNLDVAITSAVPGMTKCTLTRSIWGDDRKVVLLERGTELIGQYQGGMQQGVPRMFILWTRAKTPAGVTIALNSPGTDALGRGGVDGYIDTHFWERFGAALFLSVIDDGLALLAAQAQNNNGSGNNTVVLPQSTTQASKNAASIAVENSIRIPSTLSKNQGEHVSVFVARDLDFRTVYAIKATDSRE